jgi:hypothetical protein
MLKQLPSAISSSSQGNCSSTSNSKLAAVLSNEVCAQLFGMGAVAFKQVRILPYTQHSVHMIRLFTVSSATYTLLRKNTVTVKLGSLHTLLSRSNLITSTASLAVKYRESAVL